MPAPTAPPDRPRMRDSVNIWRTMRHRPAPIATRTDISFLRAATLASIRFATFAQVMARSRPTDPNSTNKDVRISRTIESRIGSTFTLSNSCRIADWLAPTDGRSPPSLFALHRWKHLISAARCNIAIEHSSFCPGMAPAAAAPREQPGDSEDRIPGASLRLWSRDDCLPECSDRSRHHGRQTKTATMDSSGRRRWER